MDGASRQTNVRSSSAIHSLTITVRTRRVQKESIAIASLRFLDSEQLAIAKAIASEMPAKHVHPALASSMRATSCSTRKQF